MGRRWPDYTDSGGHGQTLWRQGSGRSGGGCGTSGQHEGSGCTREAVDHCTRGALLGIWRYARLTRRTTSRGPCRRCCPGLDDLGEIRLRAMDEAGIDLQVISHAPRLCSASNQRSPLAWRRNQRSPAQRGGAQSRAVRGVRGPSQADPHAAAAELEQAVTRLGVRASKAPCCMGSHVGSFMTTVASGRSSSGPRRSTCPSTCIRARRSGGWWPRTTPMTFRISRPGLGSVEVHHRHGDRVVRTHRARFQRRSVGTSLWRRAATSPRRRCCAHCWSWHRACSVLG